MYEGRRSAITNVTCYYWVRALALWQRVSFCRAIGSWFWNCLHIYIYIYIYICKCLYSYARSETVLVFCVISVFCREVDEICALAGYYAASSGNFLSMFRECLSVPSSRTKNPLEDETDMLSPNVGKGLPLYDA